MIAQTFQPLGTPGVPWGDAEKAQWRARQRKQRSYADEVVSKLNTSLPMSVNASLNACQS